MVIRISLYQAKAEDQQDQGQALYFELAIKVNESMCLNSKLKA
jgi:hypothetical protein